MSDILGAVWSVAWSNPYTSPPNGKHRVLVEMFLPVDHPQCRVGGPPAEVQEVLDQIGIGKGYGLCWRAVEETPRQLSPEVLANVRRKRVERRIRNKYPLFADQFIEEELLRKPDYYAGITDPEIQRMKDEEINREIEEKRRLGVPGYD